MALIRTKLGYLCALSAFVVLIPALSHAADWEIQVIEPNTGLVTDAGIDMTVDVNGTAHVVYFENLDGDDFLSLKYAQNDGGQWSEDHVENDTLNIKDPKAVLAVDANGVVYVVYPDDDDYLVYSKKENGQWSSVTFALPESLPHDAEVDGKGRLNVAYTFAPEANVNDASLMLYTAPDHFEEIETHGNFQSASLVIDSLSKPRLCYYDVLNGIFKYAVKDGSSWTIEIIDGNTGGVPSYTWGSASLALDGNEIPHVSYFDFSSGHLKYANRLSGSWTTPAWIIDGNMHLSQQASIAVGSNDVVHICYHKPVTGRVLLEYAVGTAGQWQFDTVTDFNLPTPAGHLSFACDGDDRPHICYTASLRQTVEYAVAQACSDPDKNCRVDFFDLGRIGQHWFDTGCTSPDYCNGADLDKNTVVDNNDLDLLAESWLE